MIHFYHVTKKFDRYSTALHDVTFHIEKGEFVFLTVASGAGKSMLLKLILRQGMTLALVGVGAGLLVSAALTRLMKGLLYGVGPNDPLTFVGIAALLTTVTLLAALVPARRATKVDPMIALRCE